MSAEEEVKEIAPLSTPQTPSVALATTSSELSPTPPATLTTKVEEKEQPTSATGSEESTTPAPAMSSPPATPTTPTTSQETPTSIVTRSATIKPDAIVNIADEDMMDITSEPQASGATPRASPTVSLTKFSALTPPMKTRTGGSSSTASSSASSPNASPTMKTRTSNRISMPKTPNNSTSLTVGGRAMSSSVHSPGPSGLTGLSSQSPDDSLVKRRSSSRSIKRKKFDDELVESSLVKSARGKLPPSPLGPSTSTTITTAQIHHQTVTHHTKPVPQSPPAPPTPRQQPQLRQQPQPRQPPQPQPPTPPPPSLPKPVVEVVVVKEEKKPVEVPKPATRATAPPPPHPPKKPEVPVHVTKKPKTEPAMVPKPPKPPKPSPPPPKPAKVEASRPAPAEKKKGKSIPSKSSSSKSSRSKKSKSIVPLARETTRWTAEDDLSLITAVHQTNDLEQVFQGMKFSHRFSMKEIEERWYALLYDPIASKASQTAMRLLHPDIKIAIMSRALYSEAEEKILNKVLSTSQPTVDTFQDLISKNCSVFNPMRTAKGLHKHWLTMKQYHLLPDQTVQPMPRGDHVLNFSDAEDMMDDTHLADPRDEILEHELAAFDRRQKRQIRHLENEIPKWQVLVENVTGMTSQEFDNQTLAVLRGRLVRYLMRSKEITIGRSSKDNTIDVDLSLEGPAWKVSRKQGVIKLRNNGEFYLANEGKRAVHIDGKPVLKGQKWKLTNNSVVEIAGLRFIFLVNQDVISTMRPDPTSVK